MDITLRQATPADAPILAEMNRQLIEDEGSRNPMSLRDLTARMQTWLEENWSAGLVLSQREISGYILYQVRNDEYCPEQKEIYVRQFFIKREHRGQGFGRAAFERIVAAWFPPEATITLEVLETNPGARQFWQRLGFEPYCTTLKLNGGGSRL